MGQRSRTETVAAVLVALLQRRVWSQAELARSVGGRTEALRKLLDELTANGLKLESEKDHPHVYWSVPATWFPGAVLFTRDDAPDLLRQLRDAASGRSDRAGTCTSFGRAVVPRASASKRWSSSRAIVFALRFSARQLCVRARH